MWGQGQETMPSDVSVAGATVVETAFSYASPTANAHGLMVSIFPYDGTSAGLTGTDEIIF